MFTFVFRGDRLIFPQSMAQGLGLRVFLTVQTTRTRARTSVFETLCSGRTLSYCDIDSGPIACTTGIVPWSSAPWYRSTIVVKEQVFPKKGDVVRWRVFFLKSMLLPADLWDIPKNQSTY